MFQSQLLARACCLGVASAQNPCLGTLIPGSCPSMVHEARPAHGKHIISAHAQFQQCQRGMPRQ